MDATALTDIFFAGSPGGWALHERLKKRLLSRFPDSAVRVMKTCISYDDPKPYVYISFPPRKSMRGLLVTISLRTRMEHPRFFMVVPVSKARFTVHIHIENEMQIDEELLDLIALSHR